MLTNRQLTKLTVITEILRRRVTADTRSIQETSDDMVIALEMGFVQLMRA